MLLSDKRKSLHQKRPLLMHGAGILVFSKAQLSRNTLKRASSIKRPHVEPHSEAG